ncbi:MAG: spermidine synthase [Chloroflexota bacterium]|nr:spermidine synthase [Chloroflexota bacterium]
MDNPAAAPPLAGGAAHVAPAMPEQAAWPDALVRSEAVQLVLTSFVILLFELICIRWIPAYVRYLGYFSNFILLASFLGMGLGILTAGRERLWLPPFPVLLLGVVVLVPFNRFELEIRSTEDLYLGVIQKAARQETYWSVPLMFGVVALAFVPLGRSLGMLLRVLPPLRAYALDIGGSLLGIAVFFLLSYFALPPIVWFTILAVALLPLLSGRRFLLAVPFLAATLAIVWQLGAGSLWSPYYRIQLFPIERGGYVINVNNTGHQTMEPWRNKEPFYRKVYELFPDQAFKNVLILGAGSGTDVATALAHNAGHVDAVEIDPTILRLGQQKNPDQPYADPRVTRFLNDGRAFLRSNNRKYDLIIFALPDSLTLTSSFSSLRLESFLLTEDAIRSARDHLASDGVLVLYNYYRENWVIGKLAAMLQATFGEPPYVTTYGGWGRAAVLMTGPRMAQLGPEVRRPYQEDPNTSGELRITGTGMLAGGSLPVPTDDWPFIYLPRPSLPWIYVGSLLLVALFALIAVGVAAPPQALRRFNWHFFWLGAAFMLLETRSLVTFALLFGTTWLVNSLVFFAILLSVLLAIFFNARIRIRRTEWLYGLLFGMLVLNYLLPAERLLLDSPLLRYAAASVFAFAPIFLANVVFSNSFRDAEAADLAFASNLLGIMVGGMLEYTSLIFGYRFLLLPVILFYAAAFLHQRRDVRRARLADAR